MANLTVIPDNSADVGSLFELSDHFLLVESDTSPGRLVLYGPGQEALATFDLPEQGLHLTRAG